MGMWKSRLPLLAVVFAFHATPAGKFALTIDNIMRGPALYGWEPGQVRWSGDDERIYFQWKQPTDALLADPDTYVVGRDGSGLRKLSEAEAKSAPPAFGSSTLDHKKTVYSRDGDLFLYDATSGETKQLTNTEDAEIEPAFTRDEKHVAFVRANNLYVMSLDSGSMVELTDIRTAGAPPAAGAGPAFGGGGGGRGLGGGGRNRAESGEEKKGTDSQEFVKKEEKDLIEVVKEQAAKKEEEEAKKKREHPRKPFTLQDRQTVAALTLTPDEKYVIATINEPGTGAKNTIVPNFVTESGYTEDIPSRNKVGDNQNRIRLAILNVATGEVKWADPGIKAEPGAEESKEANKSEGHSGSNGGVEPHRPEKEREVHLFQPVWSEDGTKAALLARAADNKDRWIMALDETTGKTRILEHDHDDSWVDGPGSFSLGWMKGDHDLYFQSERTGYSHLYTVSWEGGEPKALTSGKWEVLNATLSKDKSRFFLVTNEVDPGEHQVYEMSADGGPRTRLTSAAGGHSCVPSPDDRWFADLYSYVNKPPELYIQEARQGAASKKLTNSPAPDFWEYPWQDVPIVTFPARDGATLHARLYRPQNFHKGGPAVVFVHGAGYLQNVHRWWSSYSHEYMFHHLLMERGYLVLDVDYRGSAGYGRDWRTGIYRHMGGKDLDDQVDAAHWLASQQGVDPKRIGVYGGSYGGFITLMAMFTQPDVFAAGAALRPVTDWAHYNHGYTANILNTPQKDADAYRESSPIYFAQGLKGALLICHGMVDTNVHFQDTVRLVQRLIELRKENWSVAPYPVENHGFVEPTSWADEYKRILDLFEKNLKNHG